MMNLISSVAVDVLSLAGCLLTVDLISGVMHWGEDTWTAPGRSALLDRWIVLDNVDHHRRPGAIRAGNSWETNRVCIALAACAAAVLVLCRVDAWQAQRESAALGRALQRLGILQSRAQHAEHHKRPYARRYCTMTDYLNPVLDAVGLWRGLERLIAACGGTVYRATAARGGF